MTELPAGVRVRPTSDGARYILPRRRWWGSGCVLTFMGLVALGMSTTIVSVLRAPAIVVAAYGVVMLLVAGLGVWLMAMGAQLTVARAEIEVRGHRVRTIERVGPVRWWRSVDARRVRAIEITDGHIAEGRHGIDLRLDDGRTLTIAPGYPESLVTPLAAVLRERHRWLVGAPRSSTHVRSPQPAPPPRPVAEIRFVDDAPTARRAECQVCGGGMSGDVVNCASCRTPHHRDCWDYNRKCSTFACGSRRFVEGARAADQEVVEIRESGDGTGLGDAVATLARELGGQMLRHPSRKHRKMRFRRRESACTLEAWRTRKGYMVELEVEMLRARREQAGRLFPAERDWLQARDMGHGLILSPARRLRRTEDVVDFVRRAVAAVDGVL